MGVYLTDLADILRGAGLDVVEVDGWTKRGWKGGTTPDGGLLGLTGGLVHHTATSAAAPGDYPSLRIVRDGRSDVPGPLAQLGLGRSGTWYVIAAGRANHSGAVDDPRWANPRCLGVEAEHPGDGTPWPPAQYASYVAGCRALAAHYGVTFAALTWRGHKEAAIPYGRKIDPRFSMPQFRADVTGAALPTITAPHPLEVPVDVTLIKSPGRGHALIAPGYYYALPDAEYLSVVLGQVKPRVLDQISDREYDVLRDVAKSGADNATESVLAAVAALDLAPSLPPNVDARAIAGAVLEAITDALAGVR